MSEEFTVSVDTSGWEFGVSRLVNHCGIEPRKVVAKETGELIKTLVRVTPPSDPAKTRQRIAKTVTSKFQAASEIETDGSGQYGGKHGKGETDWYAWSPQFLFGVAKDMDMRKADVDQLRAAYYRLTPKGRQRFSFKNRRTSQKVLITQKLFAKPATIKKLIARIQNHVGRLKAGWLVAVKSGKIILTGSNLPQQFVTKHADKARGYFKDGLDVQDFPQFTIANTGKGIGDKNAVRLAQTALNIRAKAMLENARLIFKGKKKLSDYGK